MKGKGLTGKRHLRPYEAVYIKDGPSPSCKLITLQNKSHGEIIRVCMGIFTMLWVIVVAPRNLQSAESHGLAYLSRTFHQVTHY